MVEEKVVTEWKVREISFHPSIANWQGLVNHPAGLRRAKGWNCFPRPPASFQPRGPRHTGGCWPQAPPWATVLCCSLNSGKSEPKPRELNAISLGAGVPI